MLQITILIFSSEQATLQIPLSSLSEQEIKTLV